MTIEATDAESMASTRVSDPEFLSAYADSEEHGETSGHEAVIDLSQTVYTTEHGECYHAARSSVVPACPNNDTERDTLRGAAADGKIPCKICTPPDYRDAAALLGELSSGDALVARVELSDGEQAVFLWQGSETADYRIVRRVENEPPSDEKSCNHVTGRSLLDTLVNADSFCGVEYWPVEDIRSCLDAEPTLITGDTTQQAPIDEYLDGAIDNDTVEAKIRTGVDPATAVFVGAERYHRHRHGVLTCSDHREHFSPGTVREAARRNLRPCQKCQPIDWCEDEEEHAPQEEETLEGWR